MFKNSVKGNKKIVIEKTIVIVMIMNLIFLPFTPLKAEDYPAAYLGSGYREYLSGKIQNGYSVEVFTRIDLRQQRRVDNRNQVEEILTSSYQAGPASANGIVVIESQHKDTTREVINQIAKQRQQREQGAAAQGTFNYIPYSDGKIVYFQDGLTDHIENERVVDEFGNVSYRNSYNYQYDDNRLLTGFEADTKDILGNITHTRQYGMKYTADSLFYGSKDTSANKNLIEYTLEETDPAGNKKITHFQGGTYDGKLLTAFSQTIEDSIYGNLSFTRSNITYENNNLERINSYSEEGIGIDGLAYTLQRNNVTYNDKDQITGYHEEIITTQIDGNKTKTTTDAKFQYLSIPHQFGQDVEEPDADRILESTITTKTINADGSERTETTTTKYDYDSNHQLIGAAGHNEFNGQEADWYEYTDAQGHLLSRNEDENGNVTYSYVDPDTLETVIVDSNEVTATLKDGNFFRGNSAIQFEIIGGKPMTKQVHSITSYLNPQDGELFKIEDATITYNNGLVNNLQRILGSQEHTEVAYTFLDPDNSHREIHDINLTYLYDIKGNLVDAEASGTGSGWEYSSEKGWWGKHTKAITIEYEVVLGKALRKTYSEDKDYE